MENSAYIRLLCALFLSGIIGLERELSGKTAGLRTHVLVGIGSALYAIVSILIGERSGIADIGRIAAQVVTGLGFIGAGAIFRDEDKIRGLTTAADIWTVGAIGLCAGLGYYLIAFFTTLLTFVVLIIGKIIKRELH